MQELKKTSFKDYKCLKISVLILRIRNDFPNELKSDWVFVTTRCEVDGKMYGLSQLCTWIYRDYKIDPIDNMTERSVISHIYQDPFLVEPMLDDIAKIFKWAIEWDGENIGDLKNRVALFRYEFAHTMPDERGSAAEAEWFERPIYLYHGYKVTYVPEKMVDLEGLTSSLKTFVDNYDSMIQLEKITKEEVIQLEKITKEEF